MQDLKMDLIITDNFTVQNISPSSKRGEFNFVSTSVDEARARVNNKNIFTLHCYIKSPFISNQIKELLEIDLPPNQLHLPKLDDMSIFMVFRYFLNDSQKIEFDFLTIS